ncbi:MAG: hypothetical protein LBD54_01940 [Puniceicoccales bacterium]|jgi:hypothetical protein|nr:hypothetical protein [Puniceicoccales bacterium]
MKSRFFVVKGKFFILLGFCLALSACTTLELAKVKKQLNDPNLSEYERETLLTEKDRLSFLGEGFLSGDAVYLAHLRSCLRRDPMDPDLNEKFLVAQRDAYNRREKMARSVLYY